MCEGCIAPRVCRKDHADRLWRTGIQQKREMVVGVAGALGNAHYALAGIGKYVLCWPHIAITKLFMEDPKWEGGSSLSAVIEFSASGIVSL